MSPAGVWELFVFVILIYVGLEQLYPWAIREWRRNHRKVKVKNWKTGT